MSETSSIKPNSNLNRPVIAPTPEPHIRGGMRLRSAIGALGLLSCVALHAVAVGATPTPAAHVILITIDGFPARMFDDPKRPCPTCGPWRQTALTPK
jgi:hypothetical protein